MGKRSYRQHCGIARALDVVGTRWTLLIVRNLLLGPLRFTELLRGLPGITPNLLSDRLKEMEAAGLVERVPIGGGGREAYTLTERGAALEPAIHELGRWGWPYMEERGPGDHLDPAWGMLALKRRFRGARRPTVVGLTLSGAPFTLGLGPDGVTVRRGETPEADAQLAAPWPEMARVFYRDVSLAAAVAEGRVELSGQDVAVRAFVEAFELTA